jgi:hypothetical protein
MFSDPSLALIVADLFVDGDLIGWAKLRSWYLTPRESASIVAQQV